MKPILHKTIKKFRSQLELLLEDIKLEKDGCSLAFYFDTVYLQRAALGYKDYYYAEDEVFMADKFNDDTTLVCSLVSGGFIGQFRLLPPHQNEFLNKINSNFDGTNVDNWREEVKAFVADAKLDLSAHDLLSQLSRSETDEDLVDRFTDYIETTKRGFNISHCLLPWDRRLAGWERKKLLVVENNPPDYDFIFSSQNFNTLKDALDNHPKRKHKINNFIDATALSILIELTREFRNDAKLAPRLYLPSGKRTLFRDVLNETGLSSELKYPFEKRESSVIRNEEYFFYRSFFRVQSKTGKAELSPDWDEKQIRALYDKASAILERPESIETLEETDDKPLQEIIDIMENQSFLKNVWIEFINSGDLKDILSHLKNLQNITEQFDEAQKTSQDVDFADQVRQALRQSRQNVFDNLDEVKVASMLWEDIHKKVSELRGNITESNQDPDALFRNRKLFRYGFPEESHAEIKEYLSLLLSLETKSEFTRKAIGRIVSQYMKATNSHEPENKERLIFITAILCALDLKTEIKALLERPRRRVNLHYSLKIALAGAELELNNYRRGKSLTEELEKQFKDEHTTPYVKCDLAIGLTYLYYYAWVALRRKVERDGLPPADPALNYEIGWLISSAIVFAEHANSLVQDRPLAQKVYVYNQYLFCMVESEDEKFKKKTRNFAPKLREYQGQFDVWSFMYSDTLSRYFRWRALDQTDEKQKAIFKNEALALSNEAMALAPNDKEIKAFHTKLVDEIDDEIEAGKG